MLNCLYSYPAFGALGLHLELHEGALKRGAGTRECRIAAACSLSGILNYGTPSQRGLCVYIKEPAKVWDIALGTGASQLCD